MRETEEYELLEAVVTEQRIIHQAGKRLSGCCGDSQSTETSDSAVITCSSEWCKWSINPFTTPYPVHSDTPKSWYYVGG
jgi:hypothetical protein